MEYRKILFRKIVKKLLKSLLKKMEKKLSLKNIKKYIYKINMPRINKVSGFIIKDLKKKLYNLINSIFNYVLLNILNKN